MVEHVDGFRCVGVEAQRLRGNGKQRDKLESDESPQFPQKHCSILCHRGFALKRATLKTSMNAYSFNKLLNDAIRGPAAKRSRCLPVIIRRRRFLAIRREGCGGLARLKAQVGGCGH